MQFETRIINGKPSIFYKGVEENSKAKQPQRKTTTRNGNSKINSFRGGISGEMDVVQPSPRSPERVRHLSPDHMTKHQIDALNKKLGVKLDKKQLAAILKSIEDAENAAIQSSNRRKPNLNQAQHPAEVFKLDFNENQQTKQKFANFEQNYRSNQNQFSDYDDDIKIYRPPQVVIAEDPISPSPQPTSYMRNDAINKSILNTQDNSRQLSLSEKKKLKWQMDQETSVKLGEQEKYDMSKGTHRKVLESEVPFFNGGSTSTRTNILNKIENAVDSVQAVHKSTMTLAEKKRMEWQKERESNEAVKHQSQTDLNKSYIQEQYNQSKSYGALSKSRSLIDIPSLAEQVQQPVSNTPPQNRHSLIDKKRLKWEQEREEKQATYNPYKKADENSLIRPQAPNSQTQHPLNINIQSPTPIDQQHSTGSNRHQKSERLKDNLQEYKRINDTLAKIIEAENKIKQEQIEALRLQVLEQQAKPTQNTFTSNMSDQKMVPAAMRTSVVFGNVAHDDEVKRAKEFERKKWLAELEAQKNEKLLLSQKKKQDDEVYELKKQTELRQSWNSPRQASNDQQRQVPEVMRTSINFGGNNDAPNDHFVNQNAPVDEDKQFVRTRNLLDPAQIDDLQRKRDKNLQHKLEIEAQIAEKKRIKELEEQVKVLSNLKIENEAKQIASRVEHSHESRTQQPHYKNIEKVLTTTTTTNAASSSEGHNPKKADTMADILQGDANHFSHDNNNARNLTDKSQDSYKRLQMAELAAAEEKHTRLLKRLKKGGHDTRNLENKFNEYKLKILSNTNPELVNNNNNNTNNNNSNNSSTNNRQINGGGMVHQEVNTNRNFTSMSNHIEARLEQQKRILEKELRLGSNESLNEKENDSVAISDQKMKQIFKILREDTVGMPAELTEEKLKIILQKVAQKPPTGTAGDDKRTLAQRNGKKQPTANNAKSSQSNVKSRSNSAEQKINNKPADGKKPMWNAPKGTNKPKISNTEKDPHYAEKKALIEERKQKRLEFHQALVEKNNQKLQEFLKQKEETKPKRPQAPHESKNLQHNHSVDSESMQQRRTSIASSSMSTVDNYHPASVYEEPQRPRHSSSQQNGESIMNLLNKNLKNNTIYEDEEDRYVSHGPTNDYRGTQNHKQIRDFDQAPASRYSRADNDMRIEDIGSPLGFVPFMRTDEFLDPAHAASPIPPSRETSAIKQEREKARSAYHKNQNPADYGTDLYASNYESQQNRSRGIKDPLINNRLVKNSPTPRQEQILSQLATLKQSLMQKQREVANSIQIDGQNDGYDSEN